MPELKPARCIEPSNEMLFKAKRIDTKEWVVSESMHKISSSEIKLWINNEWVTVFPGSVSPFSGMTDKNGTKIFKGDLVKTQEYYDRPCSNKRKSKTFIGEVVYDTRVFKSSGQRFDSKWVVKIPAGVGKYVHSYWSDFWNCEVVGHKYDNPELLGTG